MIEIIYNIKQALKVIFVPMVPQFFSSTFFKGATCLENPLANSVKKETQLEWGMQKGRKSPAGEKDTT